MGGLAFALANHEQFAKYVQMRVHGVHSHAAFRRLFPQDWFDGSNGYARANAVEFNPWVISKLRDELATVNPAALWNPRLAVHEMLSLARDPYAKEQARLGAMKELNVLLNITVVDENGKTKPGKSLDDFYRDLAMGGDGEPVADEPQDEPAPVTATKPKAKVKNQMSKINDRMAKHIRGSVAAKRLRGLARDAEQERKANGPFGSGGGESKEKPKESPQNKQAKYEGNNEEGFAVYSNYHK